MSKGTPFEYSNEDMKDIKRNTMVQLYMISKEDFLRCFDQ